MAAIRFKKGIESVEKLSTEAINALKEIEHCLPDHALRPYVQGMIKQLQEGDTDKFHAFIDQWYEWKDATWIKPKHQWQTTPVTKE